jgi:hypothetical protein
MAVEVKLTSLGVSITEGTIVRWVKTESFVGSRLKEKLSKKAKSSLR